MHRVIHISIFMIVALVSMSKDVCAGGSGIIDQYEPLWFASAGYCTFDIGGEFDDTIVLDTGSSIINIPEIQRAGGVVFAVGSFELEGSGAFGGSFFFAHSNPATVSVLNDADSQFRLYGLNFIYLTSWKNHLDFFVTPFVLGSISLTTLSIEDSMYGADGSIQDVGYKGYSYSFGGGLLFQLGSNIGITVDYQQRWTKLVNANSIKIEGGLKAHAGYLKVGVNLYLHD
jgi:hypothetical protein